MDNSLVSTVYLKWDNVKKRTEEGVPLSIDLSLKQQSQAHALSTGTPILSKIRGEMYMYMSLGERSGVV